MDSRIRYVSRAFALLVGIDDYSAYDASAGNPAGTSDLPAGKNDVRAAYRLCRALGIEAENIHVLTSPKLAAGELGPGVVPGYAGEATRAEIAAQVAWLAKALSHEPGAGDAPVGLLAYSGHGDFLDGHLALCPSDVRAVKGAAPSADLENVIGFPEIRATLARSSGASENLTVLLDCCHAAAAAGSRPGARAALTGRKRTAAGPVTYPGDRMLMAAAPGEISHQSVFCGEAHGALTWAATVVADQWRVISEGGTDRLTITYGELRARAQRLLDALSIPQQLALVGPPGVEELPFFHRGAADRGDGAAAAPDRGRPGVQLNPDTNKAYALYKLYVEYKRGDASYHHTCYALSTASAPPAGSTFTYAAQKEYWQVTSEFAHAFNSTADSDRRVTISSVSDSWGSTDPLSGTTDLVDTNSGELWTSTAPSDVSWLYWSTSANNQVIAAVGLAMSLDSTGKKLTVNWCMMGATGTPPAQGAYALNANTSYTFGASAPALPGGYQWYYTT